jgi:PAS domain-containing protein
MRRPLADVCLDIASFAKERKHDFLSYILRLAAAEAYKSTAPDETFELPMKRGLASRELIAGVWDWDIPNGLTYLDAVSAAFFDIDPDKAARGLTSQEVLGAVHPDDLARVQAKIADALHVGGAYECEYRLIKKDQVMWVFARGTCTLDRSGKAVRFPGAIVDITHDKALH